jgi:hypothetical protein
MYCIFDIGLKNSLITPSINRLIITDNYQNDNYFCFFLLMRYLIVFKSYDGFLTPNNTLTKLNLYVKFNYNII